MAGRTSVSESADSRSAISITAGNLASSFLIGAIVDKSSGAAYASHARIFNLTGIVESVADDGLEATASSGITNVSLAKIISILVADNVVVSAADSGIASVVLALISGEQVTSDGGEAASGGRVASVSSAHVVGVLVANNRLESTASSRVAGVGLAHIASILVTSDVCGGATGGGANIVDAGICGILVTSVSANVGSSEAVAQTRVAREVAS